jgi:hypothetical protein
MKFIDKMKSSREMKELTIERIDKAIVAGSSDKEISPEEMAKLYKLRLEVKLGHVPAGDLWKIAANVAVVAVLVGVEMSTILNQKGSRFIKVL